MGVSDPRGGRGQANEEEGVRLAREADDVRHVLRRIVDDGAMGLDTPDSDSEENDSDFDDEFDASVPNPPPQNLPIPAPRAAISRKTL